MNRKRNITLIVVLVMFFFSGCAYRLVDNMTVLNAKNNRTNIDLSIGKQVEGNAYYPYLVGYNFQDAIDNAFLKAGPQFDMLVNTTIDVKYYYVPINHNIT